MNRQGSIYLDGVNVSEVSLHRLRGSVCVVPQRAAIFHGTLRFNVDPNAQHNDEEIEECLLRCGIDVHSQHWSLRRTIQSSQLSCGEAQLICFARALLQKTHIVCLDEAFALVVRHNNLLVVVVIILMAMEMDV